MQIGALVTAILGGMTSFFTYIFDFTDHAAIATVACLPIIGGIVARVASIAKKARG